jgi:hypothetical protein
MKANQTLGIGTLGWVLAAALLSVVIGQAADDGRERDPRLDTAPELQVKPFSTKSYLNEGSPSVMVPYLVNPFGFGQGETIEVRVVGGTATPGVDFEWPTNVVTLTVENSQGLLTFYLIDDEEQESEEYFVLEANLVGQSNSIPVQVEFLIQDDESPGPAQLIAASFVANEASGEAAIRLSRRGNTRIAGSVNYEVEGDAGLLAFLGEARAGVAEFGAGESQTTIRLPIPNDTDPQPLRELRVRISNPKGASVLLGPITDAKVVIRDDDSPPEVKLDKTAEYVFEGRRGVASAFYTERGFRYLVEYADSPVATEWKELTTVFGNNSVQYMWDSTDESEARFYRYRVENELLTILGD